MRSIPTVSFLRTQAEQAGGLDSPKGQALHRAAAHVIKMHEELQRISLLASEQPTEKLEAMAQGLYKAVARQRIEAGQTELMSWEHLEPEHPVRANFLELAAVALGTPEYDAPQ